MPTWHRPRDRPAPWSGRRWGFVGLQQALSVSAGLEALALDAGREWGNRSYSLSLAAQPAGGTTVQGHGADDLA